MISMLLSETSKDGQYTIYSKLVNNPHALCVHFLFPNHYIVEEHSHNYIELALIVQGEMHIKFRDSLETFRTGEICLINRGIMHAHMLSHEGSLIFFLEISDEYFNNSFISTSRNTVSENYLRDAIFKKSQSHDFLRFVPKDMKFSEIEDAFCNIFSELTEMKIGYQSILAGNVERVLYYLPIEYTISLSNPEHQQFIHHLYESVKEYIEKHCTTVSTQELSDVFGYNRDYFNRLIKKHSGIGYNELVQSARIRKAAQLLTTTDYSIKKISDMVWYTNLGYFYKMFKNKFGMTPKQYRQYS